MSKLARKIIVLCVAIVIAAVATLGIFTDGFRHWGKQTGETLYMDEAQSEQVYAMPERLVARDIGVGVRLTATIEPATATDKTVDWSISFVNSASAWATGKTVTDYVDIATHTDGQNIVLVTHYAYFGERIQITATSRSNPSAKAFCLVDCLQRLPSSGVPYNFHSAVRQSSSGGYEHHSVSINHTIPTTADAVVKARFTGYDSTLGVASYSTSLTTDLTVSDGPFTMPLTDVTYKMRYRMSSLFYEKNLAGKYGFDFTGITYDSMGRLMTHANWKDVKIGTGLSSSESFALDFNFFSTITNNVIDIGSAKYKELIANHNNSRMFDFAVFAVVAGKEQCLGTVGVVVNFTDVKSVSLDNTTMVV